MSPTTPDLRGLHLLLVEDEYLLALGLAEVATDLGADVFGPVASVEDALALVHKLPELDAAILDINLGDATIYPVADALRARGVPFFFSTARDGVSPTSAHPPGRHQPGLPGSRTSRSRSDSRTTPRTSTLGVR